MTREEKVKEAIRELKQVVEFEEEHGNTDEDDYCGCITIRSARVAIKALEQQTCEDAVSRQAVLMELDKYLCGVPFDEKGIDEVIKDLPPVNPQHTDMEIQKIQELEQAEIQRAYELGKAEQQTCEDCISREDALQALCKAVHKNDNTIPCLNQRVSCLWSKTKVQDYAEEILKVPSVKPTEKVEPCKDAVSRQEVLDAMYTLCDTGETLKENPWRDNPHIDAVVETIEQLSPVNPQLKTGHWKKMVEVYDLQQNRMLVPYGYDDAKFGNTPVYVCDCGCESNKNSRFCPDCGARMVEPQESEVSK